MVDYSINGDFELQFTPWDDFVTVEGLEEFEQDIVIQIHDKQRELFNQRHRKSTPNKIRLQIIRIAKEFDVIDEIIEININKIAGESASYEVEVIYNTGDTFSEQF